MRENWRGRGDAVDTRGGQEGKGKKIHQDTYLTALHGKAQIVVFRIIVVGVRPSDQVLNIRCRDGAGREAQGELKCLELLILPALTLLGELHLNVLRFLFFFESTGRA